MSIGGRSALSIERRERIDGVKRGSIPEVSCDFCYARARGSGTKSAIAVCWLVAVDSQTGFIHVVPLGSQGTISPNCARVDEFQSIVRCIQQ